MNTSVVVRKKVRGGGETDDEIPLCAAPPAWGLFLIALAVFTVGLTVGVFGRDAIGGGGGGGGGGFAPRPGSSSGATCDAAATHRFVIFPAESDCAQVYLSHGSEFQCPMQYDIKLLAHFDAAPARDAFCKAWKGRYVEDDASLDYYVDVALPVGGLAELMAGRFMAFTSAIHLSRETKAVHGSTAFTIDQVLYAREFGLPRIQKDKPLTYVLFTPKDRLAFVSHYVESPPSFEQLLFVSVVNTTLGASTPHIVIVPGATDAPGSRLQEGEHAVVAFGAANNADGKLVASPQEIKLRVVRELVAADDNEFVRLKEYCTDGSNNDRPIWDVCRAA